MFPTTLTRLGHPLPLPQARDRERNLRPVAHAQAGGNRAAVGAGIGTWRRVCGVIELPRANAENAEVKAASCYSPPLTLNVAQVGNLLFRRLAVGDPFAMSLLRGFSIRDTEADSLRYGTGVAACGARGVMACDDVPLRLCANDRCLTCSPDKSGRR